MDDLSNKNLYLISYQRIASAFALFVRDVLRKDGKTSEADDEGVLKNAGKVANIDAKLDSLLNGEFDFDQSSIQTLNDFVKKDSGALPEFLYKYRAGDNNFPDNELFFSDYDKLNDPYECLLYSKLSKKYEFNYYPRLLCLSSKKNSLFMWSFYGDGGRGRCSEYECKAIANAIEIESKTNLPNIVFFGPRKVEYRDARMLLEPPNRTLDMCNALEGMFMKPNSFANEDEFRFVALKNVLSGCKPALDVQPSNRYITENYFSDDFTMLSIGDLK